MSLYAALDNDFASTITLLEQFTRQARTASGRLDSGTQEVQSATISMEGAGQDLEAQGRLVVSGEQQVREALTRLETVATNGTTDLVATLGECDALPQQAVDVLAGTQGARVERLDLSVSQDVVTAGDTRVLRMLSDRAALLPPFVAQLDRLSRLLTDEAYALAATEQGRALQQAASNLGAARSTASADQQKLDAQQKALAKARQDLQAAQTSEATKKASLAQAQTDRKKAQDALETQKKTAEQKSTALASAKKDESNALSVFDQKKNEVKKSELEEQRVSAELKTAESRLSANRNRISEIMRSNATIVSKDGEYNKNLNSLTEQKRDLETGIARCTTFTNGRLVTDTQKRAKLMEKYNAVIKQIDAVRKLKADNDSQGARNNVEYNHLALEQPGLERTRDQTQSQYWTSSSKLTSSQAALSSAKTSYDSAVAQRKVAETAYNAENSKKASFQSAVTSLDKQISSLQDALKTLGADIARLVDIVANLENLVKALQDELSKAAQNLQAIETTIRQAAEGAVETIPKLEREMREVGAALQAITANLTPMSTDLAKVFEQYASSLAERTDTLSKQVYPRASAWLANDLTPGITRSLQVGGQAALDELEPLKNVAETAKSRFLSDLTDIYNTLVNAINDVPNEIERQGRRELVRAAQKLVETALAIVVQAISAGVASSAACSGLLPALKIADVGLKAVLFLLDKVDPGGGE